jgi:RNA polymerase sigma factor (sigma-70 family)
MADQRVPSARGDEAELFREYNDELLRIVARVVDSGPEVIEDACAFAWTQFIEYQPDRDGNWKGWLFRTAQRQAWLLEAQRRDDLFQRWSADQVVSGLADPIPLEVRVEVAEEMRDAVSIMARLPADLQRIAMLRALGFRHQDIGQLTGYSRSRVNHLVVTANREIAEILAERAYEREGVAPRAQRLWELEHDPPQWLINQIGRQVRPKRKIPGRAIRLRAWRRAALALDDYRAAAGASELRELPAEVPRPELRTLHSTAERALKEYEAARLHERGCARER